MDSPSKGRHLIGRVGGEDRPLNVERDLDRHPGSSPTILLFLEILHF